MPSEGRDSRQARSLGPEFQLTTTTADFTPASYGNKLNNSYFVSGISVICTRFFMSRYVFAAC